MSYEIVKNVPRSAEDSEYAKKLAEFGVATVSEAQNKTGVMDAGIKPVKPGRSIAGTAVTVECTGADNLMVHAALEFCKPGDILVVTTPKRAYHGFFGELMATSAMKQGAIGLIMDGGVRDSKDMTDLGFYVATRYISVQGTTKKTPGNVNKTITCGDVKVNPGDFVVADDDGVVVVPRRTVKDVIVKSAERIEKEKKTRERLRNGELSVNFNSLKPVLDEIGVTYVEGNPENGAEGKN